MQRQKREREKQLEVKSIMDGSKRRRKGNTINYFTFSLDFSKRNDEKDKR